MQDDNILVESLSLFDSGLILCIGAENEDNDKPTPGYVSVSED